MLVNLVFKYIAFNLNVIKKSFYVMRVIYFLSKFMIYYTDVVIRKKRG